MEEDKLTHDERLRLECLAQANVTLGATVGKSPHFANVTDYAKAYETYIKEGANNG